MDSLPPPDPTPSPSSDRTPGARDHPNSFNSFQSGEDDSGAFRMKILLGGIALLFVFVFVAVGILVATRQRGPNTPAQNLPPIPISTHT